MKNEVISDKQAVSLIVLFISGSSLIIGSAAEAKADIWLAIILGIMFSLFIVIIYSKILSQFPGKNLYNIVENIFGKVIGKVISVIYIWYSFYLASLVLINYAEFVSTVGLDSTPKILVMAFFMFLVTWVVKEGIEVMGRWSELFSIVLFILLVILLFVLISTIESNSLKPFLYDGMKPVLNAAFSTVSFPFAETVVFVSVFDCLKNKRSYLKVYILGILLGGLIIFLSDTFELLSLGEYAYSSSYFPSYSAASRVNIKDFIQRIEIMISVMFLIGVFIKISVCVLSTSKGICKLFNIDDYRFLVTPLSILVIIVAATTYTSIMEMYEEAFSTYNYYAFSFQIIIPIIIFIGAKIKLRNKNGSNV